jgi:transcriptional regulator with XRE-family HTH domain
MLKTKVKAMAVYDYMARSNLSQKELARKLGISQCYASLLVCGARCPSPRLRRRMLETLSPLTFEELFRVESFTSEGQE